MRLVSAFLSVALCINLEIVFIDAEATGASNVDLSESATGSDPVQEQLDSLHNKYLELFEHGKELGESLLNYQQKIVENLLQTNQLVQEHLREEHMERQNFQNAMINRMDNLEDAVAANHGIVQKEIDNKKSVRAIVTVANSSNIDPTIRSCNETNSETSGLYKLLLPGSTTPITVFCEMKSFGGGWLVFQQRVNGSVDFYRNWTEYKDGFGVAGEEFWLGLSALHRLTDQASYELMIELRDSDDYKYARYSEFKIESEAEKFALAKLGKYSGTAGNELSYHSGMKFSTFDSDNDGRYGSLGSSHCAQYYRGGWWYRTCFASNLNGNYTSMCWGSLCEVWSSFTRMMIRMK